MCIKSIGPTISAAVTATEGRLDCSSLGGSTYPKRVIVHARDADVYLAQGPSAIVLHTTASYNYLLKAGSYMDITIQSAADAYIAHRRVTADGSIAVTRTDMPAG